MKVLVDCGHGIDTLGKRSPDGKLREYLFNRQVGEIIIEELTKNKVDCEMVVTETNDIPLRVRVNRINAICNKVGASKVMLISVHANACGNGTSWMSAKGWEAYTTTGKTGSDALATALYDAFAKEFPERKIRTDKSDGDVDKESNFYILQKSKCIAVLTENFFYDNMEECAWMMKKDTIQRIAKAHVDGILNYLKK